MFSINVFSKQLSVCLYFCPDDYVVDSICEQLSVNVANVRDKDEVCSTYTTYRSSGMLIVVPYTYVKWHLLQ